MVSRYTAPTGICWTSFCIADRTSARMPTVDRWKTGARLMLEVADAAISVWGAGRVGMHLAPRGDVMSMDDASPEETFLYVARELGKRKLGFLLAREYEAPWLDGTEAQGGVRRRLYRQ